jgi:pyrroline-5-carboxylate reductase
MGGAMLRGWLAKGLDPKVVRVLDPALDPETRGLCEDRGIGLDAPTSPPDVLVLAIKPQTFAKDPGGFGSLAGRQTLVVSVLAGKTIANVRSGLPNAGAIVRAMPNLPAAIGRGASGLSGEIERLTPHHREIANTLLESVGIVHWLDEPLLDAVTAVSGSGPAYVFLLTECLAEAGSRAGLPVPVAFDLARATVEGAAALMSAEPGREPSALREAVTSPGGTTAAALDVLRGSDGLEALMVKAVEAARKRAEELAT